MSHKSPKPSQLANVALLACLYASSAWAQSETKSEVSATGKSVELVYESSFQNYQRYSSTPIQSWKQANDTVKDIGGWRAYAREVTQDQDPKASTPVHSHGGHQ